MSAQRATKGTRWILSQLLVAFSLIFAVQAPAVAADKAGGASDGTRNAVVAINHAPPYRIVDAETDTVSGIYIDVIRAMATKMGVGLEFKIVPFARALYMMEHGSADFMLGPNRTAEREVFMEYLDEALPQERKAFYGAPSAKEITGYSDLGALRIGVLRGAKYFPKFDQDTDLRKFPYANYEQALRGAQRGRVDVVIMPEMAGDYQLRKIGVPLRKSPYIAPGRDSFITISKKSPFLAERQAFEKVLQALKRAGAIDQIRAKYR